MKYIFGDVRYTSEPRFASFSRSPTPGSKRQSQPRDEESTSTSTLPTTPLPIAAVTQEQQAASEDIPYTIPFTRLSQLIPTEDRILFVNADRLASQINQRVQDCLHSATSSAVGYYRLVRNVPQAEVQAVDKVLVELGTRASTRFTYENLLEALIIRVIPGPEHEHTCVDFYDTLVMKVAELRGHARRSVRGVGTTQFDAVIPSVPSARKSPARRPSRASRAGVSGCRVRASVLWKRLPSSSS
ncbi:hypothetical protein HOY82DRAFT_563611 [Tuber indicum]|nr:hypothetical protein HOY82DRAFT_563611 [Tuber indicum]